ncbi:phage holin family protein [Chryseobacterium sp.]|uniref:phage holin family protein n=1 Tax=Chryseobacterium sp. TaxID=1871047 RepID=UPI0012C14E7F|nr:phage holin family protein [Chryseobacterium sp.]MPS66831.1 hypothetical protein [Chryseobacterium sp.]
MKVINYILELAGFDNINDFLGTYHVLFPSILSISISFGATVGFLETYSGISLLLWVFMIGGTVADLLIGVYANLYYLKQEFDTTKFTRGLFKGFILFVIIFITNTFKMGIEDSAIKPEILKDPIIYITATIHYVFVTLIGLYILLSLAENLAKMQISVAVSLTKILKVKIKKIENLNENESDTTTN